MKALVTGGGGFLGSHIARQLHARGDEVIALGRRSYPALEELGITTVRADICDARDLRRYVEGCDVVFHTAALAAVWGPESDFKRINVGGTRNVIAACRAAGVRRLVYTSSPSVVFGREALCGVGESQPYPSRYLAHYPRTKAIAEREVLEANDRDLATVALRPHLIWGPGDPHLIPRLLERARAGRLARIGDGQNLVDICFVENAADAHILAADGLGVGARCAGKAYFVSQGEPVRLWSWIDEILDVAGLPPVSRSVSAPVARGLARAMELTHSALGRRGEPLLTRFVVAQLSKTHYFCIGAARRDFGYSPRVSTATGMERLARWLRSSEPLAKEPM